MHYWTKLIAIIILLSGCGKSLEDETPDNLDVFNVGRQLVQCELDLGSPDDYFTKDVTPALNCAEKNLKSFADFVDLEVEGHISKSEIRRFIKKFFKNPNAVESTLDILFIIDEYLFQSPRNSMRVSDLEPLFRILRKMNATLVDLNPLFRKTNTLSLGETRDKTKTLVENLTLEVVGEVEKHWGTQTRIDIQELIHDIKALSPEWENWKLLESSLIYKKALIGGNSRILTRREFLEVLGKTDEVLQSMITVWTVITRESYFIHESLVHLKSDFTWLSKNLYDGAGSEDYWFSPSELLENLMSMSPKGSFDLMLFVRTVEKVLSHQELGGGPAVSRKNVLRIVEKAIDMLDGLLLLDKIWAEHEKLLLSNRIISADEIRFVPTNHKEEFLFNIIDKTILSHKYFRGSDISPIYGNNYVRTRHNSQTSFVFGYFLSTLLKMHGTASSRNQTTWSMDKDQFLGVLNLYFDFVTELELWRNPVKLVSSNMMIMADIFRNTGNNNGNLELSEITEYIRMQLSSFAYSSRMFPGIVRDCEEKFEGVSFECADRWVLQHLKNDYKKYFPELFKHLREDQFAEYHRNVSLFARQCPYEEIAYKEKDLTLVMGGIISIEEAFLRFDRDTSGILEREELALAFIHFEQAIMEAGGKTFEGKTELARSLFYFLIKTGLDPIRNKSRFIWFHARHIVVRKQERFKNIIADRIDIARVLKVLRTSTQSDDDVIPDDCYADPFPVPPGYVPTKS